MGYLLHYKGKLPQTFYNLGRRQWKFVQGNEEFPVIDDDEKKHPEIVKNGKKLENGVMTSVPWATVPTLILHLQKSPGPPKRKKPTERLRTEPEMEQPLLPLNQLRPKPRPQRR